MIQLRTLCVVACFWAISQISAESSLEEKCTFTDCLFYGLGPRHSKIEEHLLSLNFTKLSHAVIHNCPMLRERFASCDSERTNCPSALEQPYEKRMYDYIYVDFLVQVGLYGCQNQHIFEQLNRCFNGDLELSLQSCFRHNLEFDRKCVLLEFYKHELCPPYAVDVFLTLIDKFLTHNPYWKAVAPLPTEKAIQFWPTVHE